MDDFRSNRPTDLKTLESLLEHLAEQGNAEDYEPWCKVGMALHHAVSVDQLTEDDGLRLFIEFSRSCPEKFREDDVNQQWHNFKSGNHSNPITIGTLWREAQESAWTPPKQKYEPGDFSWLDHYPDPTEIKGNVPYFDDKEISTHDLNIKVFDKISYVSYKDFDGNVCAVQAINTEFKKFVRDSQAAGAFASIWNVIPSVKKIIIVEGLSTGCAVADSMEDHWNSKYGEPNTLQLVMNKLERQKKIGILAAGSKANLEAIVRESRNRYPKAEIILVADRDAELKCKTIAKSYSARVAIMPPEISPDIHGFDAWDLWKSNGAGAVIRALDNAEFPKYETAKAILFPALPDLRIDFFIDTPPPTRKWIIPDILPDGIVNRLDGSGGVGKSNLNNALCVAIATGTPWANGIGSYSYENNKWGFDPNAPRAAVLAICTEDDRNELHRRFAMIRQRIREQIEMARDEFDVDDWKAQFDKDLRQNLYLYSGVGKSNLILSKGNLTRFLQEIIERGSEIENLKMVSLDPLARLNDGNENDSGEMTRLVEALEQIKEALGVTVFVTHHVNKGAILNGTRSAAAGRGSSALTDGMRQVFQLSGMTPEEGKRFEVDHKRHVSLAITKSNYLPPIDPIWLYREDGGYLRKIEIASQKTADQSEILQAISAKVAESVNRDNLLSTRQFAELYSGKTGSFGLGRQQLERLVQSALYQGLVKQIPASALKERYKSAAKHRSNVALLVMPEA